METLAIVGTGPAGLTAAIYGARARLQPIVYAGQLPGGQLTQTTEVENYPGFPDGILGFDLMQAFQKQAENFGARIEHHQVTGVQFQNGGPQKLILDNGETVEAKSVIISTGARPRWLGLPSEEKLKNKGVSSCATCDGPFFRDVPIVVVGGGDSAMEEALFLTHFASKVIVVHRRDELRASQIMQKRAFENQKIEFAYNSTLTEILGVEEDKVTGVRLRNTVNGELQTLECGAVFVAIGHIPNTDIFKGQIEMINGYIVQEEPQRTYTSVKGVFAAGDCADHIYRQAITAAGMGCRAAMDVERWLLIDEAEK